MKGLLTGLVGLAVYLLLSASGLGWGAALLASAMLVALPVLSVGQAELLDRVHPPRDLVYRSSAVTIAVLGLLGLWAAGASLEIDLGIALGTVRPVDLGLGALLGLAAVAGISGVQWTGDRLGIEEQPFLREVLPRTPGERVGFVGLSFVAGFGEEIAFRGFLLLALIQAGGPVWMAVGLSSLSFGLVHMYQGWIGVVRTSLLGAVFAVVFLVSGTLWIPIVAHVLIDLLMGLVIGERLLGSSEDSSAPEPVNHHGENP